MKRDNMITKTDMKIRYGNVADDDYCFCNNIWELHLKGIIPEEGVDTAE